MSDHGESATTPTQRHAQWLELTSSVEPEHEAGCATRRTDLAAAADTPPCSCTYPLLAALRDVAELHAPMAKARRVTCPQHRANPIYSEMSAVSDYCVDCRLEVDTRCTQCPAEPWPCITTRVILTRATQLAPA